MRRPSPLRTRLGPACVLLGTLLLWLAACGEKRAPIQLEDDTAEAPQADSSGVSLTPAEAKTLEQKVAASILLVGGHRGKHKPCGCTTPQMGGVERLAALYDLLKKRAYGGVLGLALGWIMEGNGEPQEEAKAEFIRGVFEDLEFQGILLGDTDLNVPYMVAGFGLAPVPPINVIPGDNSELEGRSNVLHVLFGERKIRVATVVDPNAEQVKTLKALRILREVLGLTTAFNQTEPDPNTLWIVAARLHDREQYQALQTALKGQGPAIVVDLTSGLYALDGGNRGDQDAIGPRPLDKDLSMFVSIDEKGKDAGVLDILVDENGKASVQFRRFPLRPAYDKLTSDSRERVLRHLDDYKDTVRARGYLRDFPTIETVEEAKYVGKFACIDCHKAVYADWETTKHAQAIPTLEKVHYVWDPECIRCHVVGFARMASASEGDAWFREASGFTDVERTNALGGVQCENCHGPGSLHAASPETNRMWTSPDGIEAWKSRCMKCHDTENSPNFIQNQSWYFDQVRHRHVPSDKRKPSKDKPDPDERDK